MIGSFEQSFYEVNGFCVARGMFTSDEVANYIAHYMRLRAAGDYPGDMVADAQVAGDPLVRFPRMVHMHRWDEISLKWMLDPRLNAALTMLLGAEPYAVQTMLYFKPPGARGQALHQDQFYLRARPGTCMAAWLALDDCDEANGCMRVAPGSHVWPVLCPEEADATRSFTSTTVPLPTGMEAVPVCMEAGDVLFFNGTLVHGSYPNGTTDRFRRSLIGHYIEGRAEQVTAYDQPILRMDGTTLNIQPGASGGPCGLWVDRDGVPVVEETGQLSRAGAGHE